MMAQMTEIAMRAAYTNQALATMGVDPTWDARLATYLRLEALDWADYEFGAMSVARENNDRGRIAIEEKYGKNWRTIPEALLEWAPIFAKMGEAENAYCARYSEPHWEASRALMGQRAPTLAAALFKAAMIEREELDREGAAGGHCMAFVIDDMARIAGGQA